MVLMPLITVVEQNRNRTPVFYGTQVPVRELTAYLRAGKTIEGFLQDFPGVSRHQVEQFLSAAETLVIAAADAFHPDPSSDMILFDQLTPSDLVAMPDAQLQEVVNYRPAWLNPDTLDEMSVSGRETPPDDIERPENSDLLHRYHHFVLIRSQALMLLQQRGHDVGHYLKITA